MNATTPIATISVTVGTDEVTNLREEMTVVVFHMRYRDGSDAEGREDHLHYVRSLANFQCSGLGAKGDFLAGIT